VPTICLTLQTCGFIDFRVSENTPKYSGSWLACNVG